MWYVFEDNEAVIKMLITGRSPTMRHVSRTHGVALDWLFDRINLDTKKTNPLHGHRTPTRRHSDKGKIPHVMNGIIFSIRSRSAFSLASCSEAMSKRMQHLTGEEGIVAKSKPTLNLVFQTAASSSTAPSSNASSRLGIFGAPSQEGFSLVPSAACTWRLKSKWRSVKFPSVANRCTEERNCEETRCCGHEPGSEFSRKCKTTCRWNVWTSTTRTTRSGRTISACLVLTYHILRMSTRIRDDNSNASQKPKMEDLNENTMIWGTFMLVTQQAAVHLGIEYLENLHSTQNQSQRTVKQLFDVTKKLVSEQTEIHGISLIDWQEKSWKRTILFSDRAIQLSTAKVYVFSDSVLSMGTIPNTPVSAWKSKLIGLWMHPNVENWLGRFDGEPIEFEWKISKDSQQCRFSPRSKTWWLKLNVKLSNVQE